MTTGRILGTVSLLIACVGLLAFQALRSPDVVFLRGEGDSGASWIMAPVAISTDAFPIDRDRAPHVVFEKRFRLEPTSANEMATLRVQALRELEISLNEQRILFLADPQPDWKHWHRQSLELPLRAGENVLRARVANPSGPPLLRLELRLTGDGSTARIATDGTWQARLEDGGVVAAIPADDTRTYPAARALPTPTRVLAEHSVGLIVVFLAAAFAFVAAERGLAPVWRARLPDLVLALLVAFWVYLFVTKMARLPVGWGFDGHWHLAYVDFLLEKGRLPFATDGWSMYHPPLFYLITASIASLTSAPIAARETAWVLRVVPFLCGLGQIFVARSLAARVFRGEPARVAQATLFAGLLPMNLTLSTYVSNEPLHALLAGVALLLAVRLLEAPDGDTGWAIGLGCILGLTALTKFTGLLLVPVIGGFLLAKRVVADRADLRQILATAAAVGVPLLLIGGWFYARNLLHFGRPLVGNWDLPGNVLGWWQQPGFHTAAYYVGFGESLRHPFFAGFHSFWDGLYSTFWGDGLLGGVVEIRNRHRLWSYEAMALGYLLSMPATALLAIGYVRTALRAFRESDARARSVRGLLAAAPVVIVLAIAMMTLRVPSYAQAKAFYGLCLVAPLAAIWADGFAAVDRALGALGGVWARAALYGGLGVWAVTLVRAFGAAG